MEQVISSYYFGNVGFLDTTFPFMSGIYANEVQHNIPVTTGQLLQAKASELDKE